MKIDPDGQSGAQDIVGRDRDSDVQTDARVPSLIADEFWGCCVHCGRYRMTNDLDLCRSCQGTCDAC